MQYNHSSFGVIGGRVQVTQWRGRRYANNHNSLPWWSWTGGSKSSWATDFKFENCWQAAPPPAAGKKIRCMHLCRSIKLNELKKGTAWE
jgi:hypothetical protein